MRRLKFLALPLAAALMAVGTGTMHADPVNSPNSQVFTVTCGSDTYLLTNITQAHDAASQVLSINGVPSNGVGLLLPGSGQRTGQQGSIMTCYYEGSPFPARLVP